jgi:hypothetical protein
VVLLPAMAVKAAPVGDGASSGWWRNQLQQLGTIASYETLNKSK